MGTQPTDGEREERRRPREPRDGERPRRGIGLGPEGTGGEMLPHRSGAGDSGEEPDGRDQPPHEPPD